MLYCDTKKIMEINGKQLILEKGEDKKIVLSPSTIE